VKTVLVTGATGAIGSVVARILIDDPDTQVRLLLRAGSKSELDGRVEQLRTFWKIGPERTGGAPRLDAYAGDVTIPALGLSADVHERLVRDLTHVIHCAGNVKLNMPLDEARRAAVQSTEHVLAFAEDCARVGRFRKLDLVSTVGVAGRWPGLVPERALPEASAFRNTYEAAKAEAEVLIRAHMARGLPVTIHRPSMVVGDSQTGRIIHFQVFYHLCEFLSGRRTAGIIPVAGDIRLDIVPVDYVARAIVASSGSDAASGRIFHLCSGPDRALTIDDLATRIHAFFRSRGVRLRPLRRVPVGVIRALVPIAAFLTSGHLRRSVKTLPYFLAYLEEPQTFANVDTDRFFSEYGLSAPAVDTYLDAVLSYYDARNDERAAPLARAS
jgi:thioester reductase-like protein